MAKGIVKKWAYVICEYIDGHASFRHAFIMAKNEEDAYRVAHRDVRQPDGNGINDYVFEMP